MNHKTDLSKYDNSWFPPTIGAGRIKQILWFLINAVFFIPPFFAGSGWRRIILRCFGARIGSGVVIKPSVNIKYPWKLTIGNYSWIGEGVWIDNLTEVQIGSNVCVSQGAMLLTGNHDYTKTTFDLQVKGIFLEDGVWIGAKALVCPGVRINSHAVLTAMSVATKDLSAFMVYQGNPASPVRARSIFE